MSPAVLTTGEAARLLGVTSQTVINWMEAGRLPFLRVRNGRRKVRSSDLRAFIEAAGIPAHRLDPELWTRVVESCRPLGSDEDSALVVLDEGARVVFWNPRSVERFGWASSEVEGRPVSCIPARVPGLPVDLADLAQSAPGETLRTLLLEIGTKSGEWLPTDLAVSWIRDSRGEIRGSVFVLQSPAAASDLPVLSRRGRPRKGARTAG